MIVVGAFARLFGVADEVVDVSRRLRRRPGRAVAVAIVAIALLTGAQYVAAKPTVLTTSISGTTNVTFPGYEVDFAFTVVNDSGTYLPKAALMIRLPPGMQLVGRPTFERAHGCTGTSALVCGLSFLEAHMTTTEHLGVRIAPDAASKQKVTAWGVAGDSVGPKVSYTVTIGSL